MSLSPSAQSGAPGQTLIYTVSVTNNDSAACASATFDSGEMGPPDWTYSFTPSSLVLAPGATGTMSWSVTSSVTAAAQIYNISAQANRGPAPGNHADGTYEVTGSGSGSGSGSTGIGPTSGSGSGSGSGSTGIGPTSGSGSGSGSTGIGPTSGSGSGSTTTSSSGGSTTGCSSTTGSSAALWGDGGYCLYNADCANGYACVTASDTCSTTTACDLAGNTYPTTEQTSTDCRVLDRDTSSCEASRVAAGLSGAWLKFSCRVNLSVTTDQQTGNKYVVLGSDGRPDYHSKYFHNPTSGTANDSTCYETDPWETENNSLQIQTESISMQAPETQTANGTTSVPGGLIGLAVNGVAIFNDSTGSTKTIWTEAAAFDRCHGHPNTPGMYHYHEEPYSITYDDDNLVGVMRDGYFIYGRRDPDGSIPGGPGGAADTYPYYGHTGTTVDSPCVSVFHYHVHYEGDDAGNSGYFVTPETFYGTMGKCTNGDAGHC